ncbi:hypothetical protein [Larkinella sp. C7]|uniref:hypothetical protein n=1 Tax=Larkinella sp. C7 TaxID=2576607 RepID=UPI001111514C|nr:hypothetical protein [Larkinella sp. C7]
MILFILLTTLAVGIFCFMVGQYWERKRDKRLKNKIHLGNTGMDAGYRRIKKELDQLLQLYKQGALSEEEYFLRTDALIDELARLLDAGSTSSRP